MPGERAITSCKLGPSEAGKNRI